MKKSMILSLVLTAVAGVLPAMAQEQAAPSDTQFFAQASENQLVAEAPAGAKRDFKRFSLTDDQLEKLHALKTQYSTANASKKTDLHLLRGQLKDALSQVTVDKSAVLGIQSKINSLQADLANSRVSFMADASGIFTPEQRQSFRRHMLMRDSMGGFGGHRGHRGHGSGGGFGGKHGGCGGPGCGKGGPGGPGGPGGKA